MNRNARHNRHANNPRNRGCPARANFNTPQTTNAAATGPAPPVIPARTRGITLKPTGLAASSITAGMMAALIATTTLEEQCKHPTIQATALAAYATAVEAAEEARKEYARSGQRSAVQSAVAIIAAANAAAEGLRVTIQVRALNQGGQGQGQGQVAQGQIQAPAPVPPVNAAQPSTAQPAAQAQPPAAATANVVPAQPQVQAQQLATAVNTTATAPAQPQLPAATAAATAGAQPRGTPVTLAQLANALNGANQALAAQPAANTAQAQGQQPAAANAAQPGPVQAAPFQPLPVRPGALPVPDPYQQLNILLHQDPNRLFNDYNFSFEGLQTATRIDALVKRNHRPKPHSPRRRIALIHQQVLNQFPLPLGQQLQIQLHMQWKATCRSIFAAQERHQKIRGVQSKLAAALNPAAAGQWALRLNKRVQKKYVSSWLAKSYRQTTGTDTTPPTHPRPFKIRDLRAETRFADRFRGQLASKRARWNKTKLQHRLTTGALIRAHLSGPLFSAAIEYQAKHSVDTLTLTRSAIALDFAILQQAGEHRHYKNRLQHHMNDYFIHHRQHGGLTRRGRGGYVLTPQLQGMFRDIQELHRSEQADQQKAIDELAQRRNLSLESWTVLMDHRAQWRSYHHASYRDAHRLDQLSWSWKVSDKDPVMIQEHRRRRKNLYFIRPSPPSLTASTSADSRIDFSGPVPQLLQACSKEAFDRVQTVATLQHHDATLKAYYKQLWTLQNKKDQINASVALQEQEFHRKRVNIGPLMSRQEQEQMKVAHEAFMNLARNEFFQVELELEQLNLEAKQYQLEWEKRKMEIHVRQQRLQQQKQGQQQQGQQQWQVQPYVARPGFLPVTQPFVVRPFHLPATHPFGMPFHNGVFQNNIFNNNFFLYNNNPLLNPNGTITFNLDEDVDMDYDPNNPDDAVKTWNYIPLHTDPGIACTLATLNLEAAMKRLPTFQSSCIIRVALKHGYDHLQHCILATNVTSQSKNNMSGRHPAARGFFPLNSLFHAPRQSLLSRAGEIAIRCWLYIPKHLDPETAFTLAMLDMGAATRAAGFSFCGDLQAMGQIHQQVCLPRRAREEERLHRLQQQHQQLQAVNAANFVSAAAAAAAATAAATANGFGGIGPGGCCVHHQQCMAGGLGCLNQMAGAPAPAPVPAPAPAFVVAPAPVAPMVINIGNMNGSGFPIQQQQQPQQPQMPIVINNNQHPPQIVFQSQRATASAVVKPQTPFLVPSQVPAPIHCRVGVAMIPTVPVTATKTTDTPREGIQSPQDSGYGSPSSQTSGSDQVISKSCNSAATAAAATIVRDSSLIGSAAVVDGPSAISQGKRKRKVSEELDELSDELDGPFSDASSTSSRSRSRSPSLLPQSSSKSKSYRRISGCAPPPSPHNSDSDSDTDSDDEKRDKLKVKLSKRRKITKKYATASTATSTTKTKTAAVTSALKKNAKFKAWREKELARKRRSEELYYLRRPILSKYSSTFSSGTASLLLSSSLPSSSLVTKKRVRGATPDNDENVSTSVHTLTITKDAARSKSEEEENTLSSKRRRQSTGDAESSLPSPSSIPKTKPRMSRKLEAILSRSIRHKQPTQLREQGKVRDFTKFNP